ncbi:ABC transporter permease [Striga asiatica]|uniref:ABC transporter permease n=1 Tax=Striga asiatica TaxID=4170 RepID=A0A5A7QVL2_STRAF|nr:ABC transporter permease [Striga asiatica]
MSLQRVIYRGPLMMTFRLREGFSYVRGNKIFGTEVELDLLSNGGLLFEILNSWGRGWVDKGYGYITIHDIHSIWRHEVGVRTLYRKDPTKKQHHIRIMLQLQFSHRLLLVNGRDVNLCRNVRRWIYFHTPSHRSWTYKPWPVSVRTNLSFADNRYIYITLLMIGCDFSWGLALYWPYA